MERGPHENPNQKTRGPGGATRDIQRPRQAPHQNEVSELVEGSHRRMNACQGSGQKGVRILAPAKLHLPTPESQKINRKEKQQRRTGARSSWVLRAHLGSTIHCCFLAEWERVTIGHLKMGNSSGRMCPMTRLERSWLRTSTASSGLPTLFWVNKEIMPSLPIPAQLESRPKQAELPSQFTFNLLATPWKTGPSQAGSLKQDRKIHEI